MNFRLPPELDQSNPLFAMLEKDKNREVIVESHAADAHRTNSLIVQMSDASIVQDALAIANGTVEHLKIGSASVPYRADTPTLIHMAKEHGVSAHLGGGILENAIANNVKTTDIVAGLQSIGVDTVEVSNARNPNEQRRIDELIRVLKQEFKVIIEVGSKINTTFREREISDEMKRAIDAEPHRITIEGSGAGNCFIYNKSYEIRVLLLTHLLQLSKTANMRDSTIIEAPYDTQSAAILHIFGWNTRLANISLQNVSNVNAQRIRSMQEVDHHERRQKILETVLSNVQEHCKHCNQCTLEEQLSVGIPSEILVHDENLAYLTNYFTQHQWKRSRRRFQTIVLE